MDELTQGRASSPGIPDEFIKLSCLFARRCHTFPGASPPRLTGGSEHSAADKAAQELHPALGPDLGPRAAMKNLFMIFVF